MFGEKHVCLSCYMEYVLVSRWGIPRKKVLINTITSTDTVHCNAIFVSGGFDYSLSTEVKTSRLPTGSCVQTTVTTLTSGDVRGRFNPALVVVWVQCLVVGLQFSNNDQPTLSVVLLALCRICLEIVWMWVTKLMKWQHKIIWDAYKTPK